MREDPLLEILTAQDKINRNTIWSFFLIGLILTGISIKGCYMEADIQELKQKYESKEILKSTTVGQPN